MKFENWNGYEIRFVQHNGEWWAVAVDVCKALGLNQVSRAISGLPTPWVTNSKVGVETGTRKDGTSAIRETEVNIINEKAVYKLAFKSRKKEAEDFQNWVYDVLHALRESTGLEGFQIFRMLDKDHQKEAMSKLNESLKTPARVDYIKANTIANKAVSRAFGYEKMLKKDDMTPDMLVKRQEILDNITELMVIKDKLGIDISVSNAIYRKYVPGSEKKGA